MANASVDGGRAPWPLWALLVAAAASLVVAIGARQWGWHAGGLSAATLASVCGIACPVLLIALAIARTVYRRRGSHAA